MPGANGIGTARGLARLFCLLDGNDFLSDATKRKISEPVVIEHEDRVIGFELTSGWGFMFTKSPQVGVSLTISLVGRHQLGPF